MADFRTRIVPVFIVSLLGACSSSSKPSAQQTASAGDGGSGASTSEAGSASGAPAAVATSLCVISADCAAGTHCDLGECIQDCNVDNACGKGDECSARARCLAPSDADSDPTPSTTFQGTVSAGPLTTLLTEGDKTLKVTLKSTSRDPVHYRIQLAAPHLSTKELRGVFTGSTDVQFAVDSSKLKGQHDVPGSIKFFTTLGDISVNAPIHTGITGKYRGALRYDGGLVNLGDARIAVDVIEKNGEVTVQFDPAQSLLLPKTAAGPATGFGSYAPGQPIELNGSQLIDHSFGGTRNHFGRDIGRKIQLTLNPSGSGNLSGTFTDNIYGLFQEPVKLSGTVTLQYEPHAGTPDFTLTPDTAMPESPVAYPSPRVFGWDGDSCALTLTGPCSGGYNVIDDSPQHVACYKQIETAYSQPLYDAMAGASLDFNALATQCDSAMGALGYSDAATGCGLVAPLACALSESADGAHDATNGPAFNRLMQEALAPALLISQNHVVQALKDSFNAGGALAELQRYDAAMTALDPIAQWVFMPNIVEYLRTMDPKIAEGADGAAATETQDDSYPAARALSKLLTVMTTIDGERARVSGVASPSAQTDLVTQAQTRAVLSYLETVTLVDTLNEWKIAPPSIAADFTGVLTPLDTGFGDLINGAGAFGVPDSFVPFVYNPKNVAKGTSNFEQMSSIASEAVASYKALEDEYRTNDRTFEQNEDTLRQQVVQVQTTYGAQISDTCGASFDISAIKSPADWSSCGANDQGQVGLQLIQIDESMSRLQSSLSRIQGMKDKIAIDRRVLAQTQNVHEDTLNFIDDTGTELDAITWSQGIIDAEQAAIQTAAQSSVMDFGAAAGLSVVTLALGVAKTELDVQRQDVQTAQTMHAEQASAQIELLNSGGLRPIEQRCGTVVSKPSLFKLGHLTVGFLAVDVDSIRANGNVTSPQIDRALSDARATVGGDGRLVAVFRSAPDYARLPSAFERRVARRLIDGGVDVVLGEGGYAAKEVEAYAHGVIAYGLGTLLRPPMLSLALRESTGLAVRLNFRESGAPRYSVFPLTFDDSDEAALADPALLPTPVSPSLVDELSSADASYVSEAGASHPLNNFRDVGACLQPWQQRLFDQTSALTRWFPETPPETPLHPFARGFCDEDAYAAERGVLSLGEFRRTIELGGSRAAAIQLKFQRVELGNEFELTFGIPDDRLLSRFLPLHDEAISLEIGNAPPSILNLTYRAGWHQVSIDTSSMRGTEQTIAITLRTNGTHFPVAVDLRVLGESH